MPLVVSPQIVSATAKIGTGAAVDVKAEIERMAWGHNRTNNDVTSYGDNDARAFQRGIPKGVLNASIFPTNGDGAIYNYVNSNSADELEIVCTYGVSGTQRTVTASKLIYNDVLSDEDQNRKRTIRLVFDSNGVLPNDVEV